MDRAKHFDHRMKVASLTITSTYYAEVWSDMDTWLNKHCQGTYHLLDPCDCWFERADDLERWYHVWHRGATVLHRTTA